MSVFETEGFLAHHRLFADKQYYFLTESEVKELKEKYKIRDYHLKFLYFIHKALDFTDKAVLEIGGSNFPYQIIKKLKVKNWVCIDKPWGVTNLKFESEQDNGIIFHKSENMGNIVKHLEERVYFGYNGYTDDITVDLHNKFDIILSLSSFEHIQNFEYALDIMYMCLKNDGILYTWFGPIWSSMYGSHFWIDSINLSSANSQFLPQFPHFLYSKKEICDMLLNVYGKKKELESWADIIKYGNNVNHYFYEDYKYFLYNSQFKYKTISPTHEVSIKHETLRKLIEMYPGHYRFDAHGCEIVALKK